MTEIYWIDGNLCQFDGEFWSPAPFRPQERELFGVFLSQMDFVFAVESPEFLGKEDYNGVPADHFGFAVTGLGLASGAQPSSSSGQYWLASDSGALLGYQVALETRTGPEDDPDAEVVDGQMTVAVTDIDAPISIDLPPDCALPPEAQPPPGLGPGTGSGAAPADPEDLPLPIRQGLAQLDAFRLELRLDVAAGQLGGTSVSALYEYSAAEGGWHQVLSATTDGETESTEVYWKDDVACQFDGTAWTPTPLTEQEQELFTVFTNQLDFVPIVTDPQFVGLEDVDGVASKHYTFTVRGLHPAELGTSSTGDYWIADDGGFLTGYRAEFAVADPDTGDTITGALSVQLSGVNGDVPIQPPPECFATPTG